jgi:hypothetical protein
VVALFADVVFFVVAVALGGVERGFGFAAGALVGLVVLWDGLDGFGHARSPCPGQRGPNRARSCLRRRSSGSSFASPGMVHVFVNIYILIGL